MDDPPLESADSSVDHQQLADDSQGPSPQDNLDAVNDTTGPEDHAATESPNELDADSLQANQEQDQDANHSFGPFILSDATQHQAHQASTVWEYSQMPSDWIDNPYLQLLFLGPAYVPVPPGLLHLHYDSPASSIPVPGAFVFNAASTSLAGAFLEIQHGPSSASDWSDAPADQWSSTIPQALLDAVSVPAEQASNDPAQPSIDAQTTSGTSAADNPSAGTPATTQTSQSDTTVIPVYEWGFASSSGLNLPAQLQYPQNVFEFIPFWSVSKRQTQFFAQQTAAPHPLSPSGLGPFGAFDPFALLEAKGAADLFATPCTGYCWVPDSVALILSGRADLYHLMPKNAPEAAKVHGTAPCTHYLHPLYSGPIPAALKAVAGFPSQLPFQLWDGAGSSTAVQTESGYDLQVFTMTTESAQFAGEQEPESEPAGDAGFGSSDTDSSASETSSASLGSNSGTLSDSEDDCAGSAPGRASAESYWGTPAMSPQPSRVVELRRDDTPDQAAPFAPSPERLLRRRVSSPLSSPPLSASGVPPTPPPSPSPAAWLRRSVPPLPPRRLSAPSALSTSATVSPSGLFQGANVDIARPPSRSVLLLPARTPGQRAAEAPATVAPMTAGLDAGITAAKESGTAHPARLRLAERRMQRDVHRCVELILQHLAAGGRFRQLGLPLPCEHRTQSLASLDLALKEDTELCAPSDAAVGAWKRDVQLARLDGCFAPQPLPKSRVQNLTYAAAVAAGPSAPLAPDTAQNTTAVQDTAQVTAATACADTESAPGEAVPSAAHAAGDPAHGTNSAHAPTPTPPGAAASVTPSVSSAALPSPAASDAFEIVDEPQCECEVNHILGITGVECACCGWTLLDDA